MKVVNEVSRNLYNQYKYLIDSLCNDFKYDNIDYIDVTVIEVNNVNGSCVFNIEYSFINHFILSVEERAEYESGYYDFECDLDEEKTATDVANDLKNFFNISNLFYCGKISNIMMRIRRKALTYEE